MKPSTLTLLAILFPVALFARSDWPTNPPQPGTINYAEGQVSLNGQPLNQESSGTAVLAAGQTLATQDGRAEILLAPGVFFRIDKNSTVLMESPDIVNTTLTLQRGRALVEATDLRPENNLVVNENGVSIHLEKPGLYDFDADQAQIRVFDGKATVQMTERKIDVKGGRMVVLRTTAKVKAEKFDKATYQNDFYRWASLRSSYLTEANVDTARLYAGGTGWTPGVWYGAGWYWDPWFGAYTFLPGDGIYYSPFGWGFYSPSFVIGAPYFGYFGGYRYFGPSYRPHFPLRGTYGISGHAHRIPGNSFAFRGNRGFGSGSIGRPGFSGGSGGGTIRGGVSRGGGFRGGMGFHGGRGRR